MRVILSAKYAMGAVSLYIQLRRKRKKKDTVKMERDGMSCFALKPQNADAEVEWGCIDCVCRKFLLFFICKMGIEMVAIEWYMYAFVKRHCVEEKQYG
ncbi:hypothetical protein K450DRAFT_250453 [Umbelopsis ramanniana AG]|uniref:Uncharacterized protein n=1 Tax=Umbelopsis ramanniana AG TaxID=1314678 RepID=A0AAD5E5U7_UMBRA|nr:uncharacterized protein K450DRAFT_250453 [Umbelopsis ramanniana AG]KAI8577703.1 hypothetical protein K450DRAFT_250453 [Umbelopsis ramanniana AG]